MSDRLPRRQVISAALAAVAAGTLPASHASSAQSLRGDKGERLTDHTALWSRLPLPFSPAQAWDQLSPATQAEIGAAVVGMALADYVSGDMHEEADHFHDDALRSDCMDARDRTLNELSNRLWSLFPDLYGPEGDHPAWALNAGLAR